MIRKCYHKLDYVAGTEYYLTNEKIDYEYRLDPNTFYVEEIVDLEKIGFSKETGNYVVLKLFKRNVDTYTALLRISKKIGIPVENIVFLGLKDKYASTTQYLFIKKDLVDVNDIIDSSSSEYELDFYGYSRRKPRKSDLKGNKFKILIDNLSDEDFTVLKKMLSKIIDYGLPSYYGYQRFGFRRFNTHILGKYLILNRFDLFLHDFLHSIYPCEEYESVLKRIEGRFDSFIYEKIVYRSRDVFKSIKLINRILRNLYVDAYASYLYNMLLNNIIEKQGWSFLNKMYPTIGCIKYINEYYKDILVIESIPLSSVYLFKCWFRKGLFKPISLSISRLNRGVVVEFNLERGFYATIIIRELFKDKFIIC